MKAKFKVGLALGGGGARGFAHIGVLKVLNAHSIPIDLIVGTSMGAVVGATFCLGPDVNALEEKLLDLVGRPAIKRIESFFAQASEANQEKFVIQKLLSKIRDLYLWNLRAAKRWLIRTDPIMKLFEELFDDKQFSDTQIPFACVAVDLNTACDVIIREGRILESVLASSSIPGVFAPFKRGNQLLADGGILSVVPARQARVLGADFVIGVDLTPTYVRRELLTGLDVMFQSEWIKSRYLNKLDLRYCDLVIKPEIVDFSWSAFSQAKFCIQKGELETLKKIQEIKQALIKKKRFHFLKKIFSLPKGDTHVD
ncbi:MAG: patatin-like phospholipase family protein [Candidatus Omnitrophota bacterium]|jgi:NTE family protein